MIVYTKNIETPVGTMIAGATDKGICLFDFPFRKAMPLIRQRIAAYLNATFEEGDHDLFKLLEQQLQAYFEGTLKVFDLPLQFSGTAFQQKVWEGLQQVPYGSVRSYKQQSIFLGNEKAIRAVARANGENCLAIIIPCHRVIGENGLLVGYAGGLPKKKWLLEHEQKYSSNISQLGLFPL